MEYDIKIDRFGNKFYSVNNLLHRENGSEPKVKMPIIQMEMGGLCLKTLQSDIFNNWVNKE